MITGTCVPSRAIEGLSLDAVPIMRSQLTIFVVLGFCCSALIAGCARERSQATPASAPVATASAAPAEAQGAPVGTITFSITGFALGLGYETGRGTLSYGGKQYQFRMSGISAIDVGVSSISGSGDVYNLKRLQDFNGTYAAATAEATLGGGGEIAYLRNQNGVVIKVTSTSQGLRFRLAPEGVKIALEP